MNFSAFFPTSWVQLHAALTHFPIALLLVAAALEGGGLLLRRAAWRNTSLTILGLAVLSLPFALLSGWLTARAMARPPVGFDWHWQSALVATAFATAWWLGRWKNARVAADTPAELVALRPTKTQWALLGLAGLSALSVGYTGHLGGEMVFGGREAEPATVASAPANADDARLEKIALAAGKMENAAGQLDVATDRVAIAAQNSKTSAPTIVAAPPSTVKVDASALDRAAQKMERVASRFESTAQKLEAVAQQLQNSKSAPAAKNSAPKISGKAPVKAPVTVSKVVPTTAPATVAFDPQLVATGKTLFRSDDLGCLGCHKMNGEGGRSGPDLTHAGRLNADIEWQIAHLKNPESKTPGSKMPAYNDLPATDLRALATYMASLQ